MKGPIRLRSILTGVVFGLLICLATPYNNMYMRATLLGGGHFPLAPFFILAWLTVFVAAVARIAKRRPLLNGLELLVAWVLMVIVSGLPYTGLIRTFFVNLTAPFHFATVGNRWMETLGPLMPERLYPGSEEAVELLYNGVPGGITLSTGEILSRIPWSAWVAPFLWWGLFIALCYFVMLCLVNLFSTQWVVNERINFPLLRLPMAMEQALDEQRLGSFLTNRFLLVGLAIPVFLHLINGLAFYFPQVPTLTTFIPIGPYFPRVGLFSGFAKLRIYIFPAFIGFGFLTSRQISFSLWFFYLAGSLLFGMLSVMGLNIPQTALGVTFGPTITRPEEMQTFGAYVIFFAFIVWLARFHLAQVVKAAFVPGAEAPRGAEWFSPRLAFWGLVFGGAGLVGWCVFFGMSLLVALMVMFAFFMMTLVASRVITQGGIAYFTLTAAPIDGYLGLFGSRIFGGVGLFLAAVAQKVLFLDLRESLMPSLVHGAKVGEGVRNRRLMLGGIVAVLVLGLVASFVAMLVISHRYGMRELSLDWATYTTVNLYENIQRLVEVPTAPKEWVVIFTLVGAAVMLALVVCYNRFYWWPLHPIGYLATYSSAMRILWFSFLIGWICNQLVLRYGGVSLFRRVRFIFFGLILGDFLMGGLWALVGMFAGSSYMVLPD